MTTTIARIRPQIASTNDETIAVGHSADDIHADTPTLRIVAESDPTRTLALGDRIGYRTIVATNDASSVVQCDCGTQTELSNEYLLSGRAGIGCSAACFRQRTARRTPPGRPALTAEQEAAWLRAAVHHHVNYPPLLFSA